MKSVHCVARGQSSTQRMRQRLSDLQVDESADQLLRSDEIDDAVVVGAGAQFVRVLARWSVDQHALARADHRLADRARLGLDSCLQAVQALELDRLWRLVAQAR